MVEVVAIFSVRVVIIVSIRRADYWLVEDGHGVGGAFVVHKFQSAGRIIGWLKFAAILIWGPYGQVSIRRADYWLVEGIAVYSLA